MSAMNRNFFMLPNEIFSFELKPREFIVLCCLLRYADRETLSCFPSRRTIAKECRMDRKTVDSAIARLCLLGLVKKTARRRKDGAKTSNMYYLADLLNFGELSME